MFRPLIAAALVAALVSVAPAADVPKFPGLDAKEWKKQDNGMKVWDAKEGKGDAVKEGGEVTAHYTLWLTNGKMIQSSKESDKPFTASLARGLIKGWQVGMPGMKPGGIRRFIIPPELAYGDQDKGDIPPNSTLVFEVELISTK
jgi:FKBP-type peptidyl-prolyl cis-trans isomerase